MTHSAINTSLLVTTLMILAAGGSAPAEATPRGDSVRRQDIQRLAPRNDKRPGLWARTRNTLRRNPATTNQATPAKDRVSMKEAWHKVREELQVYRGPALERLSDRLTIGRSTFDKKQTVGQNLKSLVQQQNIPHYMAKVNGKDVLHVVVDLAKGKQTKKTLRAVYGRVGAQTIELNYKAATKKNVYGHVAVRVGQGAVYDLTGTQGVAQLPKFMESALKALRGTSNLSFARRRNLRRFMEGRKDNGHASASVYFGMLYQAKPQEIKDTGKTYASRMKQIKEFSVSGGDGAKGVYSCAQFLTEGVAFLNDRGIGSTVGAKSAASSGRNSPQLEAVVVYKMPGVTQEQLSQFP